MAPEVRVLYWNHLQVYFVCPHCYQKYTRRFSGYGSQQIECTYKTGYRVLYFYLRFPSSWWIDKDNGYYVGASYREERLRNEELEKRDTVSAVLDGMVLSHRLPENIRRLAAPLELGRYIPRVPNGTADDYSMVRYGNSVVLHGPCQLLSIDRAEREVAVLLRPNAYELVHAQDGNSSEGSCYISSNEWSDRAAIIAQMVGHIPLPSANLQSRASLLPARGHAERQLVAAFLSMHTWEDTIAFNAIETLKREEAELLTRYQALEQRPFARDTRGESMDSLRAGIRQKKSTIYELNQAIKDLRKRYTSSHIRFLQKMQEIKPPRPLDTATILVSSAGGDPCADCTAFVEKVGIFFGVGLTVVEQTQAVASSPEPVFSPRLGAAPTSSPRRQIEAPPQLSPRLDGPATLPQAPAELPTRRSSRVARYRPPMVESDYGSTTV